MNSLPLRALQPRQIELFQSETPPLPDPMDLVAQGATVCANHSAGKDSQALLIHLVEDLRIPREQIVVIHADLGESEWEGTEEHVHRCAAFYALPVYVTHAVDRTGKPKTLLEYAQKRRQFMSSTARWCTSDWKRGPIRRQINAILKERRPSSPYVLNAMGMRAQESSERAKMEPLEYIKDASCPSIDWPAVKTATTRAQRRIFMDWLPIHEWSEEEVFSRIAAAGQEPHWAYTKAGARRLSCTICIYSSEHDIHAAVQHSAKARAYAKKIIEIEQAINHTILPPRKIKGDPSDGRRFLRDIIRI